jgi:hypothetical protein
MNYYQIVIHDILGEDEQGCNIEALNRIEYVQCERDILTQLKRVYQEPMKILTVNWEKSPLILLELDPYTDFPCYKNISLELYKEQLIAEIVAFISGAIAIDVSDENIADLNRKSIEELERIVNNLLN